MTKQIEEVLRLNVHVQGAAQQLIEPDSPIESFSSNLSQAKVVFICGAPVNSGVGPHGINPQPSRLYGKEAQPKSLVQWYNPSAVQQLIEPERGLRACHVT